MGKSLVVSYILWLFGGIWGVHHFYLKRDKHAFVWWCTLGGFGYGWIRDVFKLPDYVNDANDDPEYFEQLRISMQHRKKPSSSFTRCFGEIFFGNLLAVITRSSVPEELLEANVYLKYLVLLVVPFSIAFGVTVVGNIGREKTSFMWAVLGACIAMPFYGVRSEGYTTMSLCSTLVTNWKGKQWRRTPYKKRGPCKRVTILTFFGLIYLSLWGSILYFNASITTADGETIKLRDAVHYFFKSPIWTELKDTLLQLYDYYKIHGFHNLYDEFIKSLDPEGEANAYKVLGLNSSATQKEITVQYRKMARIWHPDKHKDPEKKIDAEKRFMEIQEAYEILSVIVNKRKHKNQQKRGGDDTERKY